MAHFVKPQKPNRADTFVGKGDGSLRSMTINGKGSHFVVVWGGDSKGEKLKLAALSNSGKRLATTRMVGLEAGHPFDRDGDHRWFILYEIVPVAEGTGTLTAVDGSGMPFARIELVISADQGVRVQQVLPSLFVEERRSAVSPPSLTPFTTPPVAAGSKLRPGTAVASVAELRFKIEKNNSTFWVGACVPEGTVDFTRVYIFFHPDTMSDADNGSYSAFSGRWPGVSRYVLNAGVQLAAVRKMVLLVPFMTQASRSNAATTNMFADRGEETLNEIMTGCQAAVGPEKEIRLHSIGVASYSSGINHLARFAAKLGGKGLIKEQIDLDSGYMISKHSSAPVLKGVTNRVVCQNPPVVPSRNYIHLGPDAWELIPDFGPAKDPHGRKLGDNIHGKIGNLTFQAMMELSDVK